MSVGLDCGTSFYIAAREKKIKKQRNAFLTVEGETSQVKRMLARQKIPYVEKSGKVHIVGQMVVVTRENTRMDKHTVKGLLIFLME